MKIEIGKKEFELKFTLGAWRRLNQAGITPMNLEEKTVESPGETIFQLVKCALTNQSAEDFPTDDFIAENLDMSVAEKLKEAIAETTPMIKDDDPKN
jgi:hypothetical protein